MDENRPTLADYAAVVLGPVLVILMVGSLVWFVVEVFYVGPNEDRLLVTLSCFVLATVLIARITMQPDIAGRATIYGAILALVVWSALAMYVAYPPGSLLAEYAWLIHMVLMAAIWWCAHRLTWDCTFVDDSIDPGETGLLQSAGLDGPARDAPPIPIRKRPGLLAWLQAWRDHHERQAARPRPLGVWVVWFSLAALPIFGLLQPLIPAAADDRRRYAAWLLEVYLSSGLGLLLLTSFLGLRRYLRQRDVPMPPAMTTAWLAVGAAFIAVMVVGGALVPRPSSEHPLAEWLARAGSRPDDRELGIPRRGEDGRRRGSGESREDQPRGGDGTVAGSSGSSLLARVMESCSAAAPAARKGLLLLVCAGLCFLALVGVLRFLANFTRWARDLLGGLSSLWQALTAWTRAGPATAAASECKEAAPLPPFASFTSPFRWRAGSDPEELVRYSFQALEALAREQGHGRGPAETPAEFAARMESAVPGLEARGLAGLYARAAYAGGVPENYQEVLARFWERIEQLPAATSS